MPLAIRQSKPKDAAVAPDARIRLVSLVIFLFGAIIIAKLFSLQILRHDFYSGLSAQSHEVSKDLFPNRGSIYVREEGQLYPLVTNRDYFLVAAEPNKIVSPNQVIDTITPILGLTQEEWQPLLARLAQKADPYEPIKHKVTKDQVKQIEAANLAGINFLP